MQLQSRDKLLAIFLPAILLFVAYAWWFWLFGGRADLANAYKQLQASRSAAVSPLEIQAEASRIFSLNGELAALKKSRDDLDTRWQAMRRGRRGGAERTAAFHRLNEAIWGQGLYTLEESFAESSQAQLPSSLQDVLKQLDENRSPGQARLWRVRFLGRYQDVVAALKAVSSEGVPVIPIGITMAEAPLETDWRRWTILFWM